MSSSGYTRAEKWPAVTGDAATLRQVFANLVGNAVKYPRLREIAQIGIGLAGEENGQILLFVRDNGTGFDMRYAGKLFGVFQRLHRMDEFEGTGIGLATAQRILARHGGRIWAEAAPDQGAAIFFTLKPSSQARSQARPAGSRKRLRGHPNIMPISC